MPKPKHIVKPNGVRQARIFNHMQKGAHFYAIREWPAWAQTLMMIGANQRTNKGRHRLFVFFVRNGLSPAYAEGYLLITDVVWGMPRHTTRGKVVTHLRQLVKTATYGYGKEAYDKLMSFRMIDMHLNKVL